MDLSTSPRPGAANPISAPWGAADPWIAAGLVLPTYLAAFATLVLACETCSISLFWPADGVVLAFLLRAPARNWWQTLLAGAVGLVCARMVAGCSVSHALILSAINLIEVLACASALRAVVGGMTDLRRPRQMLAFLLIAGFLAPAAAAVLAAGFAAGGRGAPFLSTALSWYAGDAFGLVVVTPILLAASALLSRRLAATSR